MAVVTIIGAGVMGSALAFPARENGHEVRLVGTHLDRSIIDIAARTGCHPNFEVYFPSGIQFYQIERVQEAIDGADVLIGAINSNGVDWFGDMILPLVPSSVAVLTVTEGLMDTSNGKLLTYPEVWKQKMDAIGKRLLINAMGGPCISYELVAHDQTEVTFCGPDMETLKKLRAIMTTDYFHISLSTDVVGVLSASALKNGYALGIALTIGLNQQKHGIDSVQHFNSQSAIFGQCVKEMYQLLTYQGAASVENLAVGLGDLFSAVYGGRTRKVGILLGRGLDVDEAKAQLDGVTLESLVVAVRVARAIKNRAAVGSVDLKDFPLMVHIGEILTDKAAVNIPWESFVYQEDTKEQKKFYIN